MAKTTMIQAKAMLAVVAAIGLGAFAPSAAQAQSKAVGTPVVAKAPVGPSGFSSLTPLSSPVGSSTPVGGYTTSVSTYTPKSAPVLPETTPSMPSVPVVTRMEMPKPVERTSGGEFRNLGRLEQIQSVGQIATASGERRIEVPRRPVINMLENRLIVSASTGAKPVAASRNTAIEALDAAKSLI